jgi:hypothetical protein
MDTKTIFFTLFTWDTAVLLAKLVVAKHSGNSKSFMENEASLPYS